MLLGLPEQADCMRYEKCFGVILLLFVVAVACLKLNFNFSTVVIIYVLTVALVAHVLGFIFAILVSMMASLWLCFVATPSYSFRVSNPFDVVAILAFFVASIAIAHLVSKLHLMKDEALSSVNRALVDAEERERTKIARELHDDIGQRLAFMAASIEQLRSERDLSTMALTTTKELVERVNALSEDIHDLAHSLHSPKLEYLGLVKTMNSFCKDFAQRHCVQIDFAGDVRTLLPMDVSLCLFRVLQEALGNALKHSKVRRYEVELFEQTDTIHLVVRDVGVGFNAGAALTGRGLGLISMQERIKLVKGQISFDSRPQRGTTIRAMVQLDSGSNMAGLQRYKHRLLQLLRWHDNFVLTDSDGKLIKVCTRPRNRA